MSEFRIDWITAYLGHQPKVILDVGTYDCGDAIRLKRAHPNARVIAFEASPDAHARIVDVGAAKAVGVEVVHAAVSNKQGALDFHSNTDARDGNIGCSGSILEPTPHNLAKYPFLQFKDAVKVPAVRLDEFCAEHDIAHIDVVHMDVQGAEGYAIEGLGSLRPDMLFFEIDATDEYKGAVPLVELFTRLENWGYEKKWQGAHDALFVYRKSSALDGLTVCVTNFRRPAFLNRALTSCRNAGIRRITVATSEPSPEVLSVLESHKDGWLSFDYRVVKEDIGCNSTWMLAAYAARTSRVLLLHDDDVLHPEFGAAYESVIAPALDKGVGFASWRANVLYMDGHTEPCEYWRGETRVAPTSELAKILANCLTHSPVISVLDRETVIHACKESEQTLVENESLQRQGMLLGTELVVYLRHVEKFKTWLYVDQILSSYGSHPQSGTIAEFNKGAGATKALRDGYELAKKQCLNSPPAYAPRLLLVHSEYAPRSPDEARRIELARDSWDYHFNNCDVIEVPVRNEDLTRTGADIGDKPLPYCRDLFDIACRYAMPEDIVVYVNRDIGLTTMAVERLLAGVSRGSGVTVCPRRMLYPRKYRAYKSVTNCKHDGGFDVMAVTPRWWHDNRDDMPDMLIGREAWDTVFRTLAEERADEAGLLAHVSSTRAEWVNSKAYTDDVCWHEPHDATWSLERTTNPGQKHNRKMARAFFLGRKNVGLVKLIDSGVNEPPPVLSKTTIIPPESRVMPAVAKELEKKRMFVAVRHMGPMEIFIVARETEMAALRTCVESIAKHGAGFSGVTVVVPSLPVPSWLRKVRVVQTFGFEAEGAHADEYCESATILHMPATAIMWRPCCPADFMAGGKPILVRERYADLRGSALKASQKQVEIALGIKPEYECTVCWPAVHLRETHAKLRSMLKPSCVSLGIINALGAVAIAHFRDQYACVDYDWARDCKECGVALNTSGRYIYRRDRDRIVDGGSAVDKEGWLRGGVPAYFVR